jgi:hypothetical protein
MGSEGDGEVRAIRKINADVGRALPTISLLLSGLSAIYSGQNLKP